MFNRAKQALETSMTSVRDTLTLYPLSEYMDVTDYLRLGGIVLVHVGTVTFSIISKVTFATVLKYAVIQGEGLAITIGKRVIKFKPETLVLISAGSFVISQITPRLADILSASLSSSIQEKIKKELSKKIYDIDFHGLPSETPADIINCFSIITTGTEQYIQQITRTLIPSIINFAGTALELSTSLKKTHGLIYASFYLLKTFVDIAVYKKLGIKEFTEIRIKLFDKFLSAFKSSIENIDTIKTNGKTDHAALTIKNKFKEVTEHTKKEKFSDILLALIRECFAQVPFMATSYSIIADGFEKDKVADILYTPFNLYCLTKSLDDITISYMDASTSLDSIKENIDKILSKQEENRSEEDSSIKQEMLDNPTVSFDNVSFKYPNSDQYILKDVTFEIGFGKTFAIVGKSGAGKSTIGKLLVRFYAPTEGSIKINGIDIKTIPLELLRSNFAYMSNAKLFEKESIKYNVLYGVNDNNEDVYTDAIDKALVKDFENQQISTLSEGQKQRVVIARTLARNSNIFFFDEPTSALDNDTEQAVIKAIVEVPKTKLLVTHKLSAAQSASKILFFKQGRIAQSGTHAELIANEDDNLENYAKLWHIENPNSNH